MRCLLLWAVACLATVASVGGCGTVEHHAVDSSPGSNAARTATLTVDPRYSSLPFDTTFTKRWNGANDGTAYEPCTALSNEEFADLGVSPDSVSDAAGTDGQTARGCKWHYGDSASGSRWVVIQIVGNSSGLAAEKRRVAAPANRWLPDLNLGGRPVGVHFREAGGNCETYVQSGAAAVSTIVTTHDDRAAASEICDRAIAFTKATIHKIPH